MATDPNFRDRDSSAEGALPEIATGEVGVEKAGQIVELGEQLSLRLELVSALLPPPAESRTLRKAVQVLHSYPTNGTHTGLTRRLLNALVAHAQDVFQEMTPQDKALVRDARGTPLFTVQIRRLLKLMQLEHTHNYDRIYEAIDALHSWVLRWNVMGDTGNGLVLMEEVKGRIISQWGKGVGPKAGLITYEMPHDSLLLLMEPRPYAQIDLSTANELGTSYAIGLYEACVRYLGTANKVTAVLPIETWIAMIAGVGKYQGSFKDFNRYCVRPAMRVLEVTDSCPFTVEPKLVYGPYRKVVGLQFKLILKQQKTLRVNMPPTWDPRLIDVLRKVYGFADSRIAMLAKTASQEEIQEAMARDAVMVVKKQQQGTPIQDRGEYLLGILRNVQAGRSKDAEPEAESVEVSEQSAQKAVLTVAKLREEFEQYRTRRLYEEIMQLPSELIEDLRSEFSQSKADHATLREWINAGWEEPHPGLKASFASWLYHEKGDLAERMLRRPEDCDLSIWMVWREERRTH